jgi:hypothetical protein
MLRSHLTRYCLLLGCLGVSYPALADEMRWNPFSHMSELEAAGLFAIIIFLVVGAPLLIGLVTWLVIRRWQPAYGAPLLTSLVLACLGWWVAFGLRDALPAPAPVPPEPMEEPLPIYEKRQALIAAEPDSLRKAQLALLTDNDISNYGAAEKLARQEAAARASLRVREAQGTLYACMLVGLMGLSSAGAATAGYYYERKPKK